MGSYGEKKICLARSREIVAFHTGGKIPADICRKVNQYLKEHGPVGREGVRDVSENGVGQAQYRDFSINGLQV